MRPSRHCNCLRPFKQIQKDAEKSCDAMDPDPTHMDQPMHLEKGGSTKRYPGMMAPGEAQAFIDTNVPGLRNPDGTMRYLRNNDEMSAVASTWNAGRVPRDVMRNTFRSNPNFDVWPTAVNPERYPGTNIGDMPRLGDFRDANGDVNMRVYDAAVAAYNQRYKNKLAETDAWRRRDRAFRDMALNVQGGSGVGLNAVKYTENEKGDRVLDLMSAPVDYFGDMRNPDIIRRIETFMNDNDQRNTFRRRLLDKMTIRNAGVFNDTAADINQMMIGMGNLDDTTIQSLTLMADLLGSNAVKRVSNLSSSSTSAFDPSDPITHRDAAIRLRNGNPAVNSAYRAGHAANRFHEFRHLVSAARNTTGSHNVIGVNGVEVYESDVDALEGLLSMASNPIVWDKDENKAFVDGAVNDTNMRWGTHDIIVGELMSNCRMLKLLMNGKSVDDLKKLGRDDINMNIAVAGQHDPKYYAQFGDKVRDIINIIINESLSAMIEIQANGDMGNPFVRKLIEYGGNNSFKNAYFNFSKEFMDLMPKNMEWAKADVPQLSSYLLSGKRRYGPDANRILSGYVGKSRSKAQAGMSGGMSNYIRGLIMAKMRHDNEHHTPLETIVRELPRFKNQFRDKTIYLNCDNPDTSMFVEFFRRFGAEYGVRKVIATYYVSDGFSKRLDMTFENGRPVERISDLGDNGDFLHPNRQREIDESDIIISNPPYSTDGDAGTHSHILQAIKNNKQVISMGTNTHITHKDLLPLFLNGTLHISPNHPERFERPGGGFKNVRSNRFTTMSSDVSPAQLEYTAKFDPATAQYDPDNHYLYVENYRDIPVDYTGNVIVPITCMHNPNPKRFTVVGVGTFKKPINGRESYKRFVIRNRRPDDVIATDIDRYRNGVLVNRSAKGPMADPGTNYKDKFINDVKTKPEPEPPNDD